MEADIRLETLWKTFQHLGKGNEGAKEQREEGKKKVGDKKTDRLKRVERQMEEKKEDARKKD